MGEPVPGAKRQDVDEPPDADAPYLTRDPLPQARAGLSNHHDTGDVRKRSEPPYEAFAIERGFLVTDQQRPHRYQEMPR